MSLNKVAYLILQLAMSSRGLEKYILEIAE